MQPTSASLWFLARRATTETLLPQALVTIVRLKPQGTFSPRGDRRPQATTHGPGWPAPSGRGFHALIIGAGRQGAATNPRGTPSRPSSAVRRRAP
jgi:hypothetical protein